MTKEQKIEAYAMRLDGLSLQEIADHFGVSKQYIQQMLPTEQLRSRRRNFIRKPAYPNLEAWLFKRGISNKDFAEMLEVSAGKVGRIVSGEQGISKSTIDKILAVTGMTYEEAFAKEDSNEA